MQMQIIYDRFQPVITFRVYGLSEEIHFILKAVDCLVRSVL